MDKVQIKSALISVYYKDKILDIAEALQKHSIKILASGTTCKTLQDAGFAVTEISDYTSFPEILDGRVKTLHPKIHSGILADTRKQEHIDTLKKFEFDKIDLVIVNLYPFLDTVQAGKSDAEIIEKIDIGGPSMIRGAAKNFASTAVVCDIEDYELLLQELEENKGSTSFETRRKLSAKAFSYCAYYDATVARWMNEQLGLESPKYYTLAGELEQKLRYGENSHQQAALYKTALEEKSLSLSAFKQINGKELSYNNIIDADAALEISASFGIKAGCAIVKHASPCGIASASDLSKAYEDALDSDKTSAFGGIVAVNRPIDASLMQKMLEHFYEIILAPSINKEAEEVLNNSKKKSLRVLVLGNEYKSDLSPRIVKSISGGFVIQDRDNLTETKDELIFASNNKPATIEIEQFLFAYNAVRFVKSNGILVVDGTKTVAISGGQTSRVIAVEQAVRNAAEKYTDMSGLILASDAFFPFADNIEIIAKSGIKRVIATGGSVRDEEVIEAANKYGITLVFAKNRHFKH